jgi:hypothetical protein
MSASVLLVIAKLSIIQIPSQFASDLIGTLRWFHLFNPTTLLYSTLRSFHEITHSITRFRNYTLLHRKIACTICSSEWMMLFILSAKNTECTASGSDCSCITSQYDWCSCNSRGTTRVSLKARASSRRAEFPTLHFINVYVYIDWIDSEQNKQKTVFI